MLIRIDDPQQTWSPAFFLSGGRFFTLDCRRLLSLIHYTMESYSSSSKLELGNSLLHSTSNESSPQSSNNGDMKRKNCSGGGSNNGQHLIPTSVPGLTSDLTSLYALENLHHHHHHHHSAGLSHHHSHHSSHHHNLIGGGNSSITSIAPSTSSSQSIQSGAGGLLNSGNPLGLPGKFLSHFLKSILVACNCRMCCWIGVL